MFEFGGTWEVLRYSALLQAHLSSSDPHATVVELQLPQCVAGRTLQQLLDSLHTIWPKGVIAQVQLSQSGP